MQEYHKKWFNDTLFQATVLLMITCWIWCTFYVTYWGIWTKIVLQIHIIVDKSLVYGTATWLGWLDRNVSYFGWTQRVYRSPQKLESRRMFFVWKCDPRWSGILLRSQLCSLRSARKPSPSSNPSADKCVALCLASSSKWAGGIGRITGCNLKTMVKKPVIKSMKFLFWVKNRENNWIT